MSEHADASDDSGQKESKESSSGGDAMLKKMGVGAALTCLLIMVIRGFIGGSSHQPRSDAQPGAIEPPTVIEQLKDKRDEAEVKADIAEQEKRERVAAGVPAQKFACAPQVATGQGYAGCPIPAVPASKPAVVYVEAEQIGPKTEVAVVQRPLDTPMLIKALPDGWTPYIEVPRGAQTRPWDPRDHSGCVSEPEECKLENRGVPDYYTFPETKKKAGPEGQYWVRYRAKNIPGNTFVGMRMELISAN